MNEKKARERQNEEKKNKQPNQENENPSSEGDYTSFDDMRKTSLDEMGASNKDYSKQEIISYVKLENIKVKQSPAIGEIKIYKPVQDENILFKNQDENIISEITFTGAKATNTRNLEISNQGGPIAFRCANLNVGNYTSNDDEEINFEQLLKKLNVKEEDLKSTISFDIIIALNSKKVFKAENVEIKIPNENIVEIGRVGFDSTDLKDIVFKRIEN